MQGYVAIRFEVLLLRAIAPLSFQPNRLGFRSLCQVYLYEHLYLFIENLASTVSAT